MSDSAVVSDAKALGEEHLAPEEVLKKLESLSAEDKIQLRLIERRRRSGTDFLEGHLYREAICLALLGDRKCPRDVPLIAFLFQTMRSLASHRRAQLKRQESYLEDKPRRQRVGAAESRGSAQSGDGAHRTGRHRYSDSDLRMPRQR